MSRTEEQSNEQFNEQPFRDLVLKQALENLIQSADHLGDLLEVTYCDVVRWFAYEVEVPELMEAIHAVIRALGGTVEVIPLQS